MSLYDKKLSEWKRKYKLEKGLVFDCGTDGKETADTLQSIIRKNEAEQAKFIQRQLFGAYLSNLAVEVKTRRV